jgi:ankyrin repeat protein
MQYDAMTNGVTVLCGVQDRTLLMLAASNGQMDLMDLLIQKGVAVKDRDTAGRTALQVWLQG